VQIAEVLELLADFWFDVPIVRMQLRQVACELVNFVQSELSFA